MSNDYETLAEHYRAEVISKLPPASILPKSLLATLSPGADLTRIPETCGLLSDRQIEITRLDAVALVECMRIKTFSAEEVMLAFGMRAAIVHQLVRMILSDASLEADTAVGLGRDRRLVSPTSFYRMR